LKKKISGWIFFAMFLLMALLYHYHKILFYHPMSVHQWRQCDCLSITLNYFKENRSFLNPSVCWIGENGTGETISEFPIIYYTVAQLWKIFGQHEFIFRALVVLLLFTSLYFLFRTFERFLNNSFWAIGLVMLLFTSPIWVYYGNNFLADVPALSIALIGWYYFMKFYQVEKNKYLFLSMFFFLLGGLIKISSLISFISIGGVFLIETLFNFKLGEGKKIFSAPRIQCIPFIVLITIISIWYKFAMIYNRDHSGGIFLTGILPIWDFPHDRVVYVWNAFRHKTIYLYYNKWMLHFIIICFGICLLFYKKTNRFLLLVNIFMAIGVLLFLILWYDVIDVHDYYLTNLLIFTVITLFNFFILCKNARVLQSKIFTVFFLVFLIYNIFYAAACNSIRYFSPSENSIYSWVLKKEWMDEMRWNHWNYISHLKAYESIEPYNRSLGIKRTDFVISTPDPSINISLYLMDQKGFTDYGYGPPGEEKMKRLIQRGAKYLFINNKELYNEAYLSPFIKNKIGAYQNIDIYSLSNINASSK
jgi:dolichyl-phosphate-mannose-protein mannosyltransferase